MDNGPSMAALIEVLKSSEERPGPKDWSGLEEHVQAVYQTLIDLDGEKAVVGRNVHVRGRDGSEYQIDVYYEFELAGVRHRVAIECKNTKRAVERNDVIAFKGKVEDCFGLQGIIVAANGFQEGATKYANDNGIIAIKLNELPSIGRLLGMRLESVAIPGAHVIGQPFWTVYDIKTFAPFGMRQGKDSYALLFYSKHQAERYVELNSLDVNWCVRGLEAKHLAVFILTVDAMNATYVIAAPGHMLGRLDGDFVFAKIDRGDLISTYCKDQSLPENPMVMPSLR